MTKKITGMISENSIEDKILIKGIKLIKHNMGGINNEDDPSFGPYRLNATFRVPSFMEVAAVFIYGNEEIILRGKTEEALEEFISLNNLRKHHY